jgi:hypothetical protein
VAWSPLADRPRRRAVVHHTWRDPDEHARRPFERIRDHVLLPYAGSIQAADDRHGSRIDEATLTGLVDALPDAWLPTDRSAGGADDQRAAYVRYLLHRLEAPRTFVEEAERAPRGVASSSTRSCVSFRVSNAASASTSGHPAVPATTLPGAGSGSTSDGSPLSRQT